MFITTHAVIGALIGRHFNTSPETTFVLAIGSHFLADVIPHGDSGLYKGFKAGTKVKRAVAYVALDALVAIFVIVFFLNLVPPEQRFIISVGIIGGVLPDLLIAIYEIFHVQALRWFHRLHFMVHDAISKRVGDMPLFLGIISQTIFLVFIIYFSHKTL